MARNCLEECGVRRDYFIAAVAGPGVAAGASAAGLSSVEIPPAVPEVQEPGTCSLLDADVAPHWPAKPGVYVRGAFTRQMGAQQLACMGGGARCGANASVPACRSAMVAGNQIAQQHDAGSCTLIRDMCAPFMYQIITYQPP